MATPTPEMMRNPEFRKWLDRHTRRWINSMKEPIEGEIVNFLPPPASSAHPPLGEATVAEDRPPAASAAVPPREAEC